MELKKTLETKTDALERLKAENHDMTIILNTDQFKTVRTVESELRKVLGHNKELIHEVQVAKMDKARMEEEMKEFKAQLDILTEEIERKLQEEKKVEKMGEDNRRLDNRIRELEHKISLKDEELRTRQQTIDEMLRENEKMNEDIDYFKNLAKTSKMHAERAVADVDAYKKMLSSSINEKMTY
jgi:hypothetical protein